MNRDIREVEMIDKYGNKTIFFDDFTNCKGYFSLNQAAPLKISTLPHIDCGCHYLNKGFGKTIHVNCSLHENIKDE